NMVAPLTLICAIIAAFFYYVGFAPPRVLRRAWQFTELRGFLLGFSSTSPNELMTVEAGLAALCRGANLALGGMAAVVIEGDDTRSLWGVRYVSEHPELATQTYYADGMLKQTWYHNRALFFRAADA